MSDSRTYVNRETNEMVHLCREGLTIHRIAVRHNAADPFTWETSHYIGPRVNPLGQVVEPPNTRYDELSAELHAS